MRYYQELERKQKLRVQLAWGFILFFMAVGFIFFELWLNQDYYTARCAGYGYEADCTTPLKGNHD